MTKNAVRLLTLWTVAVLGWAAIGTSNAAESSTNRVGIYDSRAIAYAYFWSPGHQQKIKVAAEAAKAARKAGDTNTAKLHGQELKSLSDIVHLQVFSIAPATEAMAFLKDRLPAIQSEAGVSTLVSKWDKARLQELGNAEKVDVTARLLAEFKLNDKQQKIARDLLTKEPLDLETARELVKKGEL